MANCCELIYHHAMYENFAGMLPMHAKVDCARPTILGLPYKYATIQLCQPEKK